MEENKGSMSNAQIIEELITLLKENNRSKQADDISLLTSYVVILEGKVDMMTYEIIKMNRGISEYNVMKTLPDIRDFIAKTIGQAEKRIIDMKRTIVSLKVEINEKASCIFQEFKKKGKSALNKTSEFFGVKEKLEALKEKFDQAKIEIDKTIIGIEGFEAEIKATNEQIKESCMILTEREPNEYIKNDFFRNDISLMKKPWLWQRQIYQNMIPVLDGAIGKVDNLSKDVQIYSLMK